MTCETPECGRPKVAKGKCRRCYARQHFQRPEVKAAHAESKKRYRADPEKRARERALRDEKRRARYATDPEYREREKEAQRALRAAPGAKEASRKKDRARKAHFPHNLVEACRIAQEGRCALCARAMVDGNGFTGECADHCHVTRTPRGLLCGACNMALGAYEKYQRPAGLRIEVYESYLSHPPVRSCT